MSPMAAASRSSSAEARDEQPTGDVLHPRDGGRGNWGRSAAWRRSPSVGPAPRCCAERARVRAAAGAAMCVNARSPSAYGSAKPLSRHVAGALDAVQLGQSSAVPTRARAAAALYETAVKRGTRERSARAARAAATRGAEDALVGTKTSRRWSASPSLVPGRDGVLESVLLAAPCGLATSVSPGGR